MRYWDDMVDKYGFDEGGIIPPDAEACRSVYVHALNAVATRKGSSVRAAAYNRPGVHNPCLIVMVPKTFFRTLTSRQIAGLEDFDPPRDEVDYDKAWDDAFDECMSIGLDGFVETEVRIRNEFWEFIKNNVAGS